MSHYYKRGVVYYNIGNHGKALSDYMQSLLLEPNRSDVYLSIGLVLKTQGRLREALMYFTKAAQLGHEHGAQYANEVYQQLAKNSLY